MTALLRQLPRILFATLTVSACARPADEGDLGVADRSAYSTQGELLRASSDPNEQRLAAVESLLGTGLKAFVVWQRNSAVNGRDVWLTLGHRNVVRVWKTNEDVMAVHAAQFTTGRTRFVGTYERLDSSTGFRAQTFWLDVGVEYGSDFVSPTLSVRRSDLGGESSYTLQATDDTFGSLLGQVTKLERVEGSDELVRLFLIDPTQGSRSNEKRLVLVLTDRETHRVFPLSLRVDWENMLAFTGAHEIQFDTSVRGDSGEETKTKYAVSWQSLDAPTIRLVRID